MATSVRIGKTLSIATKMHVSKLFDLFLSTYFKINVANQNVANE